MTAGRSRSATDWALPKDRVLSIECKTLQEGTAVFRCHNRLLPDGQAQGSWFFSSGAGRFDLPRPLGSLNVAEGKLGAVLESFSSQLVGRNWVRREEVDRRKLVNLRTQSSITLVDLRSSSGLKAGVVPGELTGAAGSYDRTQALAYAIYEAGRDRLAAPLRFGSAFRQDGFYIFGTAGPGDMPEGEELSLDKTIDEMGYRIVGSPPSTDITLKS